MCAGQRWHLTYRHFQVTTLIHYHLGSLAMMVGTWENGKIGKWENLRRFACQAFKHVPRPHPLYSARPHGGFPSLRAWHHLSSPLGPSRKLSLAILITDCVQRNCRCRVEQCSLSIPCTRGSQSYLNSITIAHGDFQHLLPLPVIPTLNRPKFLHQPHKRVTRLRQR